MEETINGRLNELIQVLGVSKNGFAQKINVSSALISKITTQRINFGVDVIEKIISAYPSINLIWLVAGEGEMFQKKAQQITPDTPYEPLSKEYFLDFKLSYLAVVENEIIDLVNLIDRVQGKGTTIRALSEVKGLFKPVYDKIDKFTSRSDLLSNKELEDEARALFSSLNQHATRFENYRRDLFQKFYNLFNNGIFERQIIISKTSKESK